LHNSLLQLPLKNCDFLNIDISQGSVATRLGCGGVFKFDFVTNFLLSLTVKKTKNRLTLGEVVDRSIVSCFSDSQCAAAGACAYICCTRPSCCSGQRHVESRGTRLELRLVINGGFTLGPWGTGPSKPWPPIFSRSQLVASPPNSAVLLTLWLVDSQH